MGRQNVYERPGTVLRAMQRPAAPGKNDVATRLAWKRLTSMHQAMTLAFDSPYELKIELEQIEANGREALAANPITQWSEAIEKFIQDGHFWLLAWVLELRAQYLQKLADKDEAVLSYGAAASLLQNALDQSNGEFSHQCRPCKRYSYLPSWGGESIIELLTDPDSKFRGRQKKFWMTQLTLYMKPAGCPDRLLGSIQSLRKSSGWRERK